MVSSNDAFVYLLVGCAALCVIPKTYARSSCPKNEIFSTCGTSCPDTCQNKDDTMRMCNFMCNSGCFCKDGYVREDDSDSAPCVREEECCPENMEFQTCGVSCPDFCGAPTHRVCTANCVQGCFCKEGYVLKNNGKNAKCILADQCPQNNA